MSTPESYGELLAESHGEPLVDLKNVTKKYGARIALAPLSLTLASGEVFGLVGANGGGKTTTLRILAGLLAPDSGGGKVLGHDLRRDAQKIRAQVGYMSQRFALYPSLSVVENLRFRAAIYNVAQARDVVQQLLHHFELGEFRHTRASQLSGGWARKLQLAAALVHGPRLLLLDEPTAGLDGAARLSVWQHIMQLANQGASVVICTHDLPEAERCSRVALLSDGMLRASGTPQAVIAASSAIALMVSGTQPLSLLTRLSTHRSVIACYPQGGELRMLVERDALASIEALLRDRGYQARQVALSFEDATLALSRPGSGAMS